MSIDELKQLKEWAESGKGSSVSKNVLDLISEVERLRKALDRIERDTNDGLAAQLAKEALE